uniref:Uncharacterized protein n=1 Tax=Picea glauca TaxID=3330 RepID=A0A101LWA7_PICGL|nr:hypothetical protein ABT39_MTgene1644 [Picea glauca]QHR87917.1 hypothetical protein Q903MT_gene1929 [Picea sitchensis]
MGLEQIKLKIFSIFIPQEAQYFQLPLLASLQSCCVFLRYTLDPQHPIDLSDSIPFSYNLIILDHDMHTALLLA